MGSLTVDTIKAHGDCQFAVGFVMSGWFFHRISRLDHDLKLLVTSLNRPLGSVGEILGRCDTRLASLPLF